MSVLVLNTSAAVEAAVSSGGAVDVATALDDTQQPGERLYIFVADVSCWISQGTSPTASAADGSTFVPAATQVILDGSYGTHVSALGTASGHASITPASVVR